jgi:hypothetical protein
VIMSSVRSVSLNFFFFPPSKVYAHLSFMHQPINTHVWGFVHSCDHLQGVLHYKYQEYNRNHIN